MDGSAITADQERARCRLFVGNLPKSKTDQDIFDEVSRIARGRLLRVITYKSFADPRQHRGFCFLDYGSALEAADAKRALSQHRMFGCRTAVDWADPEPAVDADTMAAVRILFVKQYGGVLDDRALAEVFGRHGPVERVKNLKNYAFVHFERREDAQSAMDALDGSRDDDSGVSIDVSWAKPPADKQTRERVLRDRERRIRQSVRTAAAAGGPVRAVPAGRTPMSGATNGAAAAAAAAAPSRTYTEYDHCGYDFGTRRPCDRCSAGAAVIKATADECSTSNCGPRGRGDEGCADDARQPVSLDHGDWTTNRAKTLEEKLLNFFHRVSTDCAKRDY